MIIIVSLDNLTRSLDIGSFPSIRDSFQMTAQTSKFFPRIDRCFNMRDGT